MNEANEVGNQMNEASDMSASDFASMLCSSIDAAMEIRMRDDKVTVSGGTALYITDMYMILKALEVIGGKMLPMMKGKAELKEAMKKLIGIMEFKEETNAAE
jgi:hypothetical protein